MKKKTIRMNKTEFNSLIAESVKRILKEYTLKEGQDFGDYNDIRDEVEAFVEQKSGNVIEQWHQYGFTDDHGFDGYIFDTLEDATEEILNGGLNRGNKEYLETSKSDEGLAKWLRDYGVKLSSRYEDTGEVSDEDLQNLLVAIIKDRGPEFFLATYSGEYDVLEDGRIIFY